MARKSPGAIRTIWLMTLAALGGIGAVNATQVQDLNSLEIPQVGTTGLRVLAPTVLELTLITTKAPDPARVTEWNFVTDSFAFVPPAASEFNVRVNGQTVSVKSVHFKRRPIYAPLKTRDLRLGNYLYLTLNSPVGDNQSVEVLNPSGALWASNKQFQTTANPLRHSPAIHVNQVGYMPEHPKKAMVGYYLGTGGELSLPSATFSLVDAANGTPVFQGQLTRRPDSGYTYTPAPYTNVYEANFSAFQTPGEYQLVVPGLGASFPFRIDAGTAATFARTYALGLYHQRCGGPNEYPYSRCPHAACHTASADVPTLAFQKTQEFLAGVTSDYASNPRHTAPQLKDINASLYPYVTQGKVDVAGGHHDAGDYSKYTINSAGLIHHLVFAADAFAGAGALDNLGLPESGDGKSDLLQEAKWEADFLAKMQDADGGFYFLVYPRDRKYEDDVLPDKGDPQVVWPKTTAVTAAAVAALAEIGSSPLFRQQFPVESALYLAKAQKGWAFLEQALLRFGKDGAYQKITHYGNEFMHDDELAWAASAMFAATGNPLYHQKLKEWCDPSSASTRRWSWWRLFEGYGSAIRTYAFAARTGRLTREQLDPTYLGLCETEIHAAAEDHLRFARQTAYNTSFPDLNKAYRSAGWYFSSERAFDITVAYQLTPRADYLDAVMGNLNFEAGCNPVNVSYITGLGWKRWRDIVHHYAQNDQAALPPTGLPLGNVQAGFAYLYPYKSELGALGFPADGAGTAPYAYFDRWGDSFNTTTEFVVVDQARSLASLSFWMAQSPVAAQPWRSGAAVIETLPGQSPAGQTVTATLAAPGLDLSQARIVWEAKEQEPFIGPAFTFTPKFPGDKWVEAEAVLPDGRRVFAKTAIIVTTDPNVAPNAHQSQPVTAGAATAALYHCDGDVNDSTGKQGPLALTANARLDASNVGWMAQRAGTALKFEDLGDKATLVFPTSSLYGGSSTTAIILEAMVYVNDFKAYNRGNAKILSLVRGYTAALEFGEDKYAGIYVRGGSKLSMNAAALNGLIVKKQWHHLRLAVDRNGYSFSINGALAASAPAAELQDWNGAPATLEIGNFDGWIDEIVVTSSGSDANQNLPPSVSLVSPLSGAIFTAPGEIAMSANASDLNGIAKVEFFAGTTKLGEKATSPYTFTWTGAAAGAYVLTARAMDTLGATATSLGALVTVSNPLAVVATPTATPSPGSFEGPTSVALACGTADATIRYTTDGTAPSENSTAYTSPLTLAQTTTIRARAYKSGYAASAEASFTFTIGSSGSAYVKFVTSDATTGGDWKGKYGADGYSIPFDDTSLPPYAQMNMLGNAEYIWSDTTAERRALERAASSQRLAACWYSASSFTIQVNFTDTQSHRVALYFLDWDRQGRAQKIEVIDSATGQVVDTRTISNFAEGVYLVWDISGSAQIRVTKLLGSNAVVMGAFFSPSVLSPRPSVRPKGFGDGKFKLQLTGEPGKKYSIEATQNLRDWNPIGQVTLVYPTEDYYEQSPAGSNRFYRLVEAP